MGGRRYQYHLVKTPAHDDVKAEVWCDAKYYWGGLTTDPEDRRVCPDCARKYWSLRLKEKPNGYSIPAKGLTEPEREAVGSRWGFRAMFPVTGPAGNVGFIVLRNGFGAGYAFVPWRVPHGEDEACANNELRYASGLPHGYNGEVTPVCKEHALYLIPQLVKNGELKDRVQIERDAVLAKEAERVGRELSAQRRAKEEVEAQRQRAIYNERTAEMIDGLRSLAARAGLTNLERVALVEAMKRLNVKPG